MDISELTKSLKHIEAALEGKAFGPHKVVADYSVYFDCESSPKEVQIRILENSGASSGVLYFYQCSHRIIPPGMNPIARPPKKLKSPQEALAAALYTLKMPYWQALEAGLEPNPGWFVSIT